MNTDERGIFMANQSSFPYKLPFQMDMQHAGSITIQNLDEIGDKISSAKPIKGFHVAHMRIYPHNHAHSVRDTLSHDLFAFRQFCSATWDAEYIASMLHVLYLDGSRTESSVYRMHTDNPVTEDPQWKGLQVFENVVIGRLPSCGMHYLSASEWDHMSLFISSRVLGHVPNRNPGMVWIANRDEGSSREWFGSGDVAATLQGLGYNVSTERPGKISFERQVLLARTASFIVGPHGSNLASMVLAGSDVSVAEILAPDFMSAWYAQQALFQSSRWVSYPARTNLAASPLGDGRSIYPSNDVAAYLHLFFSKSGASDIECENANMKWHAANRSWTVSSASFGGQTQACAISNS
jgi:hypothetical protein